MRLAVLVRSYKFGNQLSTPSTAYSGYFLLESGAGGKR